MAIQQITHYTIQVGIKHGMTVEDFCSKYGCTEADFEKHVKHLFRRDCDDVMGRIRSNVRKKNRNHSSGSGKKGENHSEVSLPELPEGVALDGNARALFGVSDVLAENVSDETSAQVTNLAGSNAESQTQGHPRTELQRLHEQEQQLSGEVMALESRHKATARKHRDCIKQLRGIKDDLERIQQEFREKSAEYEAIIAKNNDFVAQMNQTSAERAEKVKDLEQIRDAIKELTVIVVCAYENGQIELMDNSGAKLDETGSDDLFGFMRAQEQFDDLRGRDIRLIARLLCIARNSDIRIEPMFENESLEPIFRELLATQSIPESNLQELATA